MDHSLWFCCRLLKTSVRYSLGVIASYVWIQLLEIKISCCGFQPRGDFVLGFGGGVRLAWVLNPCVDNIPLYQWTS